MSTQSQPSVATVPSVPPENFRFIPGITNLVNGTMNTNGTNGTYKQTYRGPYFNGTGYYIEEEGESGKGLGLSDLQTLLLACIATFIPLIVSLLAGFGIRFLWKKYRRYRDCNNYDGDVLHREENSEPSSKPLSSHLFNSDQIKCSETHLSITGDDMEICDGTTTVASGPQTTRSTSHSSTNGSIITMTLKNNHLIVETEERSDLEEDSRETTMKYSPGARDGVFVVEVQQGSRRSPASEVASTAVDSSEASISISNQCALVHNPPERYNDQNEEEELETKALSRKTSGGLNANLKTGLAQSDSSLTSSMGNAYRYGNQQGYEAGYFGYPTSDSSTEELAPRPVNANKPKIISEIFKTRSDSQCSPDEFYLSDRFLNGGNSFDLNDPIQEEQNRLGNSKTNH